MRTTSARSMEPISPELCLVDPVLAQRARELLPPLEEVAFEPAAAAKAPRRHRRLTRLGGWVLAASLLLNVALLWPKPTAETQVFVCDRPQLPVALVYHDSMADLFMPQLSENFRRVRSINTITAGDSSAADPTRRRLILPLRSLPTNLGRNSKFAGQRNCTGTSFKT